MATLSQPAAWRSEGDLMLRKNVIDQIRAILGQRQGRSNVQAGFPDMVKRLELVLYQSAATKEEYSNPRTLMERLGTVAQHLQSKRPVAAPAYPEDACPAREAPFARDESCYRGIYAIPPVRSGADLFTSALDDGTMGDLSPRTMGGFVAGPEVGGHTHGHHAPLAGDGKARWLMPAESKGLMSSDVSDDGFVSAINETWSNSGTSSAAFTGISDSSLWLGDTSNLWYTDELDIGPDHGVDTHSGASLDSIPRTPQGFSNVARPAAGSTLNPSAYLPRRASCPGGMTASPRVESMGLSPRLDGLTPRVDGGIGLSSACPRMDGASVAPHLSPRVCEGEFLGTSTTSQPWKSEDSTMWDATTGCQGSLLGHDAAQQMFISTPQICQSPSWANPTAACGGTTLVGYDEGLRSVTTQPGHPVAGLGMDDGFGGVAPVQLSPGRGPGGDAAASRVAQAQDFSGAGSLARQPDGLARNVQVPVSGTAEGRGSMGSEFLKTEGQMRKFALRGKVDPTITEMKKCKLLGDIPENAVAIGSMPGVGVGGPDGQQTRQVAKNSMLPPRPTHSGSSPRDAPKFSLFPQRGMAEESKDGMSTTGVKDELVHAYTCKLPVCSLMCNHLRLVIDHAKTCSKRTPSCGNCRWLGLLLSLHARNCHDPHCPLPCCK